MRSEPAGNKGRKRQNVFYDNWGLPGSSDLVDRHMHGVNDGRIIRMWRFSPLPQDHVDPAFKCNFIEKEHGPNLENELDLSHLSAGVYA